MGKVNEIFNYSQKKKEKKLPHKIMGTILECYARLYNFTTLNISCCNHIKKVRKSCGNVDSMEAKKKRISCQK